MSRTQWVVGSFQLNIGEPLKHVNERYGRVYKCTDQTGQRCLVRLFSISPTDESLMRYTDVEKDMKVSSTNVTPPA